MAAGAGGGGKGVPSPSTSPTNKKEVVGSNKSESSSSSIVYTVAKIGLMTAFAPVVIPYYVAKTSINVAMIPVRAVLGGGQEKDSGVVGLAQRTVKYCWETSKPYVQGALPKGVVYKLDIQVKRLTGAPPSRANTPPPLLIKGAEGTDEMYKGGEKKKKEEGLLHGDDDDLDLGLEPLSPLSSVVGSDLPTPATPQDGDIDMLYFTSHESQLAPSSSSTTNAGGSLSPRAVATAWAMRRRRSSVEDMTLPTEASGHIRTGANTADETVIVHSKSIKPRKAIMYIQDGAVCWSFTSKIYSLKGTRSIRLDKVKQVVQGKRTEGFQGKHSLDVSPDCCLSILSDDKVVAVQFRSSKARDDFSDAVATQQQVVVTSASASSSSLLSSSVVAVVTTTAPPAS